MIKCCYHKVHLLSCQYLTNHHEEKVKADIGHRKLHGRVKKQVTWIPIGNNLKTEEGKTRMPTIKDVAKLARVAPSTVSYVLSGKRPISSEVRKRVNQAVDELSFKPNRAATQLRTG
ncbi:MAG: LacI family DNA-binding transcriptional regulator, partial [Trueperaceae bacterium]